MIGTIRKHQAWLWYIIIAVTIVTFVGFLSPSRNRGYGNGSSVDFGSVFGEPVGRQAFRDAMAEERLDFRLRYNQWPAQEEQLRQMGYDLTAKTYQRLFLNAKVKELKIEVSNTAVLRRIRQYFGLGPDQALPQNTYAEFVVKELNQNNCSQFDFERFVRNKLGHEQLISLFGMSGELITPKEAESFYRRENEPVLASVAFFTSTNFARQVDVTPQALHEYYTNNQSAYRIPERVEVAYIKFDKTNFLTEVSALITNFDQTVSAIYAEKGAAAFKDKDGKQMPEAEAKALIKTQVLDTGTLTLARKKANTFINEIYEKFATSPFSIENFTELANEKGLEVFTSEPFDAATGPKLKVTSEFTQAAFGLSETNRNDFEDKTHRSLMYKKPLSGEDAAYVIALKRRIPSRLQSFEEVKSEVIKDYKHTKASELATVAGDKFGSSVTNGLASGKTFGELCEDADVKPINLPPFSMATRVFPELDKNQFQELQRAVSGLPVGKASPFMQQLDGGFVVYVKERQAVDLAKMKTELPTFIEQLRANRQIAAFNEWFQKNYPNAVRRPVTSKDQG